MAPTPEERGVADRGVVSRGFVLQADHPAEYDGVYHAKVVSGMEFSHQMVMTRFSTERLLAWARAKHKFLLHHSDKLEGTPAEVARAQSDLAKTLLAMRQEAMRRVENPTSTRLGKHSQDQPDGPIDLIDSMDPFMQYRLWKGYVLPEPKPRKREKRKAQRSEPTPDPPRKADPIFVDDDGKGVRKAANKRIEQAKRDMDDLMKGQTDIFNRITFVMDGAALGIELGTIAGVATIGVQILGTGLAAASVLFGTVISMGQGVQASEAVTRKNGFKIAYRYYYHQLENLKGKAPRVSYKQAYRSLLKDKIAYRSVRTVYSLSDGVFKQALLSGMKEAATVVNKLADIADEVTREQFAPLRKKYSAAELQDLFHDAAHRNRLRLYRAVKKKLKFR